MTRSSKYRSYGLVRNLNLSDIGNPELSLDNLINNLPEVVDGKTFISADLDAVRGLSDSRVFPINFEQLVSTTPTYTFMENGFVKEDLIRPIVRLKDRFVDYRSVTNDEGALGSGLGPTAHFIPSNNISVFNSSSTFLSKVSLSAVETSDDYWVTGEFQVNSKFRPDFPDHYGGVMWEGYFYPDIDFGSQSYSANTTGLLHIEYDRFDDGNWIPVISIYAEERPLTVTQSATNSLNISIVETMNVGVGDHINGDVDNLVVGVGSSSISLTTPITVTTGDILIVKMDLGRDTISVNYTLPIVIDAGELPIPKIRFFWWYPTSMGTIPELKYLLNYRTTNSNILPFYTMNKTAPTSSVGFKEVRGLLNDSVTASQESFGSSGSSGNNYRTFTSNDSFISSYVPKSSMSEITIANNVDISFKLGERYVIFLDDISISSFGNYIIPIDTSTTYDDLPKNTRIKSDVTRIGNSRIISETALATKNSLDVRLIDHNGLVDYYVTTSSSDLVTLSGSDNTNNLSVGMICITPTSSSSDFIRITEIISATVFRVSTTLSLSSQYIFIYANSGLLDRTKEVFCEGVSGKILTGNATGSVLSLDSVSGLVVGQIVQFDQYIPSGTSIVSISSLNVTISASVMQTIETGATIVFSASNTTVNKEQCVIPLDLSPPFSGVPAGLSTNTRNIRSTFPSVFNVKFFSLVSGASVVGTVDSSSANYDRTISAIGGIKILAKLV